MGQSLKSLSMPAVTNVYWGTNVSNYPVYYKHSFLNENYV